MSAQHTIRSISRCRMLPSLGACLETSSHIPVASLPVTTCSTWMCGRRHSLVHLHSEDALGHLARPGSLPVHVHEGAAYLEGRGPCSPAHMHGCDKSVAATGKHQAVSKVHGKEAAPALHNSNCIEGLLARHAMTGPSCRIFFRTWATCPQMTCLVHRTLLTALLQQAWSNDQTTHAATVL
jgi:hypothetical protein